MSVASQDVRFSSHAICPVLKITSSGRESQTMLEEDLLKARACAFESLKEQATVDRLTESQRNE